MPKQRHDIGRRKWQASAAARQQAERRRAQRRRLLRRRKLREARTVDAEAVTTWRAERKS